MNKKIYCTTKYVLLVFMLMSMLCGCGKKNDAAPTAEPVLNDAVVGTTEAEPETETETAEELSDEQAISAVRNYCCVLNPDLESIVKAEEYPVYWEIISSDEQGIVVLYRSYTGAQVRYYIDRASGDTYVTEFVPGITEEEQRTDESFNVKDYFSAD